MDLHVTTKVAPVVEVFPANGTGGCELPRAAVDGHVVLKVAQLRKTLGTFSASVSGDGGVPPHVDVQGISASKHL